jgi:hypothetical protein
LKEIISTAKIHVENDDRNHLDEKEFDKGGKIYANFNLTHGTYSEKDDLNRAVEREFGRGFSIA